MNIDEQYYKKIDIAKKDIANNNFDKAINELLNIINVYGEEKDVLFELGKVYFLCNKKDDSEQIFKKIIKYKNKDVYLFLIKILKHKKNNEDIKTVIEYLKECVSLFYNDSEIKLELQQTLMEVTEHLLEKQDFFYAFKTFFEFYRFFPAELKELKNSIYLKVLECIRYDNIRNNKEKVYELADKLLNIIPVDEIKIRNSLLNEKEIAEGKIILSSKPRKLQLVLTNKCNLRCVMCNFHNYDWSFNKTQLEQLKRLIPYLELLIWQGGEVFLSKDFMGLFDLASNNNVKQTIITNALLINDSIAEKIVQNNVSLAISIDDIEKEGYEKIRKGGKFENLISNLKLLNTLKNKNKISNFNMQLSVVIMKSNYNKLDRFLDFAKTYGFSSIELNPINLSNNNYEEQIFFPRSDYDKIEYINSVLPDIYKKATKLGIKINSAIPTLKSEIYKNEKFPKINGTNNNNKYMQSYECNRKKDIDLKMSSICKTNETDNKYKSFCFVPWYSLMIDLDGYVSPSCICPTFYRDTISEMSIDDVWNSKTMSFYRTIVRTNSYNDICGKCSLGDISEERRF